MNLLALEESMCNVSIVERWCWRGRGKGRCGAVGAFISEAGGRRLVDGRVIGNAGLGVG
jgi:hypothetical protein